MIKIILAFMLAFGPAFSFAQPARFERIDYPAGDDLFACKCSRRHKSSDMDCRCIPARDAMRLREEAAMQRAMEQERQSYLEAERKLDMARRAERNNRLQAEHGLSKEYWRWRPGEPESAEKSWIEKSQNIKMVK